LLFWEIFAVGRKWVGEDKLRREFFPARTEEKGKKRFTLDQIKDFLVSPNTTPYICLGVFTTLGGLPTWNCSMDRHQLMVSLVDQDAGQGK
jgi:hypothetical protein